MQPKVASNSRSFCLSLPSDWNELWLFLGSLHSLFSLPGKPSPEILLGLASGGRLGFRFDVFVPKVALSAPPSRRDSHSTGHITQSDLLYHLCQLTPSLLLICLPPRTQAGSSIWESLNKFRWLDEGVVYCVLRPVPGFGALCLLPKD